MLITKRKPAIVGEILVEEFMQPMGLTQTVLAKAMGVPRKHVNELCNDRRRVTASTALILARVFGNSQTSGSTSSGAATSGTPRTTRMTSRESNGRNLSRVPPRTHSHGNACLRPPPQVGRSALGGKCTYGGFTPPVRETSMG